MSVDLKVMSPDDLNTALQEVLLPRLKALMSSREPGHCMRVPDLDVGLIEQLAREIRRDILDIPVYILSRNDSNEALALPFISSTKLVELRNPLPDGKLRPPLLVFLPPNLK